MVLTILSSTKVVPTDCTPNGRLPLSESDQVKGWTHAPTVYVYRKATESNGFDASLAFESLKNSLSQILVPYYTLAGRLHWIGGGRLELDCCGAGIELVQASCDVELDAYGDFEPTVEVRELVPKVDYTRPIEELPVLLVQMTKFSCGGVCVGFAISHIVLDGIAAVNFINSWASIARGEKTSGGVLETCHDRKPLIQHQLSSSPPRFDHPEYRKPPLLMGCSTADEERKKEIRVALLKVSKEQVERLKKRANELTSISDDNMLQLRPYSRYESVAGHVWACACKARSTGESRQPSALRVIVDIRRRLRPPVPDVFSGNASLVATTPICEFGDLISNPLSYAARKIREGTAKFTDEYAKSALAFLASHEDISWARSSFHTLGCSEAPFWGNPNLALGCWITLPFYDADFGWGDQVTSVLHS